MMSKIRRNITETIGKPFNFCVSTTHVKGIKRKVVFDMAKLFATIESERTSKHQIGNEFLEIKIYYGSKDAPQLLTHILVKHGSSIGFFQHNTVEPKPFTMEKAQAIRLFRVFSPFNAYLEYLKRNGITYKTIKKDGYEYIEFDAQARFNAKEDYYGLCAMCGYIVEINEDGSEQVVQSF